MLATCAQASLGIGIAPDACHKESEFQAHSGSLSEPAKVMPHGLVSASRDANLRPNEKASAPPSHESGHELASHPFPPERATQVANT